MNRRADLCQWTKQADNHILIYSRLQKGNLWQIWTFCKEDHDFCARGSPMSVKKENKTLWHKKDWLPDCKRYKWSNDHENTSQWNIMTVLNTCGQSIASQNRWFIDPKSFKAVNEARKPHARWSGLTETSHNRSPVTSEWTFWTIS